jgi:hypothetical protein
MVPIRVIVRGPDEGSAELWCGDERFGATVLYEGRLHLRIEPREDSRPWLVDTTALMLALDRVARELGAS